VIVVNAHRIKEKNKMSYQIPKPIPKSKVRSDMGKYEEDFSNQTRTLSQFFATQVVDAWDCNSLSAAELLTLKENTSKKTSVSLIVLELKT
jgi:hypothetical protein